MPIASINPATGETIAEFPETSSQEQQASLQRAIDCFSRYRNTTFRERAGWMRHAAGILRERSRELARTMTLEMGKPIAASESEVEKCAWVCEYYAENAQKFLTDEPIATDASKSYVAFQPIGPVLAIMPWNFPLLQCFRFAA